MTREISRTLRLLAAAAVALWLLALLFPPPAQGAVPERANQYRRLLIQAAHLQFGLDAPISLFAAQVHQESAWRPAARSPFAEGLTQFTPDTSKWIASVYPQSLGPAQPYSPKWALNAMARYNRHLYDRILRAAADCDRWAMTLAAYNGGPGWITRDRRLAAQRGADPNRWWGHVEHHSPRARWAFKENRDYPQRIIHRHQPLYLRAGWGGPAVCLERP
ncbi:MAG: lytic transglycosylase domain-containing protein [Candidatus Competibacteraceae bacterium]|nr:MAG: lytic transglycosylase domain-containing protein [Candidatus Competibacteraceae bacterium]